MNNLKARLAWLTAAVALLLVVPNQVASTAAVKIDSSTSYTASLNGLEVWRGELPTRLTVDDGYSSKIEFPIVGLLPVATLADRAYGVRVEFEIWTQAGKKVAYDTVYSSDWNPVGPDTIVSMYGSEVTESGQATMLVRTMWTTRTNGLVSSYLKTEYSQPVEIVKGFKPKSVTNLRGVNSGKLITYSFSKPASQSPIVGYLVRIEFIANNALSPSSSASYLEPMLLKTATKTSFTLKKSEVQAAIKKIGIKNPKYFQIRVVATTDFGEASPSNGIYTQTSTLR
jgi:hypothetical protein